MQRVKTSTAVSNLAAYTESGTPGYFTAGDAVAGTPATVPGAQWFNQVQEELLNVIKAANITPDATKDNQLAAAIAQMIAAKAVTISEASETVAGILKLATQAMVDAGTDGKAAVTPATLAARLAAASQTVPGLVRLATAAEAAALTATDVALSPATIAATLSGAPDSGWTKLPNGLLFQWGRDRTTRSSETTVTGAFPITWPVGCLVFAPTIYHDPADTSGQDCAVQGGNPTATTWSVFINFTGSGGIASHGFDWFAIGK